jgi:hypothetical protein
VYRGGKSRQVVRRGKPVPDASEMHARGDDGEEVIDIFRQATAGGVPIDQPQSAPSDAVADRAGFLA